MAIGKSVWGGVLAGGVVVLAACTGVIEQTGGSPSASGAPGNTLGAGGEAGGSGQSGAPGASGTGAASSSTDGGSAGGTNTGGNAQEPPPPQEGSVRPRPPAGAAERALECQADHPPLRRLNHREYANSVRDLFSRYGSVQVSVAPDARREGFTNNFQTQTPTQLTVTEYLENATELSQTMAAPVVAAADCGTDANCFRSIVLDLGRRAYRRPLQPAEVEAYAAYFDGAAGGDIEFAVRQLIATLLQAPDFIYRPEFGGSDGTLTSYEVASRLSYFLWATLPDEALLTAAAEDRLSGEALEVEVDRMLADPRARHGVLAATAEWFELERLENALKAEQYGFSAAVRADLIESLERFVWERVFSDGSLETLFTSNGAYVNRRIGPLFGVQDAGDELEWRQVEHRSGILTHPAVLAIHGYGDYPSPVRRGVFLLTEILCDPPAPPPPGVSMGQPETTDDTGEPITNRDGYRQLTQSTTPCTNCHDVINPYGFAFEHYDTVGAYRTRDNGSPVDASGTSSGFSFQSQFVFDDAMELNAQLSESDRVRACVVDRWVRYAAGGGPLIYDPCLRADLEKLAQRDDASLRDIIIAIAIHPKFAAAEVVE